MKYRFHLSLLALLFVSQAAFGQTKPRLTPSQAPLQPENISPALPFLPAVPAAEPVPFGNNGYQNLPKLPLPMSGQPSLRVSQAPENGLPYRIEGQVKTDPTKSTDEQVRQYLNTVRAALQLDDPAAEFRIARTETDELGITHIRLQQQWMGVPVHGAEAILHQRDGAFYLFNGRYQPSAKLPDVTPTTSSEAAAQAALAHVAEFETVKNLSHADLQLIGSDAQTQADLVIFYEGNQPRLAWHVTVLPHVAARYAYFVDAKTGEVLHQHSELCKIAGHFHGVGKAQSVCEDVVNCQLPTANWVLPPDGPATANANDLFGQSRLINTYQVSNTFFLIDASQTMFDDNQSTFPNEPVGVIWTIDAENTSPENNDFGAVHVTSNNNAWNNQKAVSAHYHAEKAYDYFKNTFNRNSINGQGGNIVSLINVVESDGSQMDNAFWNGQAMFYGNGSQAFTSPLQKALDVAGHEMSHGVVQATANLEYLGESGALNESFADVFGAMIDRDDWQMGEDVTNSQFFPTGALRDLSNPHNGGNSLNDNGWQPAHYTERYTGSEDNGGVHINSGIVNKAFVNFANASGVGKNKAEQVWYRALNLYLTKSSNFVDCRLAVVQASTDLHGANSTETNAAKAAFDAVGIGSSGGSNNQDDLETNPGDDYILMTDVNSEQLYVFAGDGSAVHNPLTSISPLSRPSVTDNGSVAVYIDQNNKMRAIVFNWNTNTFTNQVIQNEPIWRNVAISKDGGRLAALTTDNDNRIWIYDYGIQGNFVPFELFNPTTAQGGPSSDNVQYADVLEWDHTSQWVMYDALSAISTGTQDIEFWDIGFIYVWDGAGFANGYIEKLYSSLPEDVSVGNPTFSKNSPYIISFDYFDEYNEEFYLLCANIETGDVGTIYDQGTDLYWPNYSPDDTRLVFNANLDDANMTEVLAIAPLANDKINPNGDPFVFVEGGRQGVWFADGNRALAVENLATEQQVSVFPNPAGDALNVEFTTKKQGQVRAQAFDLIGRLVLDEAIFATSGENRHHLDTSSLGSGTYLLRLSMAEGMATVKFSKN